MEKVLWECNKILKIYAVDIKRVMGYYIIGYKISLFYAYVEYDVKEER